MALGDELTRNTGTSIEGPLSLSNVTSDVEVEELGNQTGGRGAEGVEAAPLEELNTGGGELVQAARQESGEVPPDNDQTPPGAASPEEGQQLGDAVKKVFEAIQTPGAQQALGQMGLNISGAAEGGGGGSPASAQQTPAQGQQQGGGVLQAISDVAPEQQAEPAPQAPEGEAPQQQGAQEVPVLPPEELSTETSLSERMAQFKEEIGGGPEGEQLPAQAPSADRLAEAEQAAGQPRAPTADRAQSGGGLLANRDLQRALIAFGQQISPEGDTEIGDAGNQLISAQAQAEFRERLDRGESPGAAAGRTQGLTAEGQSSVLEQFRQERQRGAQRDVAETETEIAEEEQQTQEELAQARIQDMEFDQLAETIQLEQSSEKLKQQAESELDKQVKAARRDLLTARAAAQEITSQEGSVEGADIGERVDALRDRVSLSQQQATTLQESLSGVNDIITNFRGAGQEVPQETKERQKRLRQRLQSLQSGIDEALVERDKLTLKQSGTKGTVGNPVTKNVADLGQQARERLEESMDQEITGDTTVNLQRVYDPETGSISTRILGVTQPE